MPEKYKSKVLNCRSRKKKWWIWTTKDVRRDSLSWWPRTIKWFEWLHFWTQSRSFFSFAMSNTWVAIISSVLKEPNIISPVHSSQFSSSKTKYLKVLLLLSRSCVLQKTQLSRLLITCNPKGETVQCYNAKLHDATYLHNRCKFEKVLNKSTQGVPCHLHKSKDPKRSYIKSCIKVSQTISPIWYPPDMLPIVVTYLEDTWGEKLK